MDAAAPHRLVDLGGTKPRADWCAAAPAYQLAEEIKKFWRARGAEIAVRVVQINPSDDNRYVYYGVRSNLVRGLPHGWNAEKLIKARRD